MSTLKPTLKPWPLKPIKFQRDIYLHTKGRGSPVLE